MMVPAPEFLVICTIGSKCTVAPLEMVKPMGMPRQPWARPLEAYLTSSPTDGEESRRAKAKASRSVQRSPSTSMPLVNELRNERPTPAKPTLGGVISPGSCSSSRKPCTPFVRSRVASSPNKACSSPTIEFSSDGVGAETVRRCWDTRTGWAWISFCCFRLEATSYFCSNATDSAAPVMSRSFASSSRWPISFFDSFFHSSAEMMVPRHDTSTGRGMERSFLPHAWL